MTLRNSYSVSPVDGIGVSPLLGTASAALDREVDATEIDGDAPPLEVVDHDERDELGVADVPGESECGYGYGYDYGYGFGDCYGYGYDYGYGNDYCYCLCYCYCYGCYYVT